MQRTLSGFGAASAPPEAENVVVLAVYELSAATFNSYLAS
jgi:hypothetical protein